MNHPPLRRLANGQIDDLLDALTVRQHLSPHEPLSQSLSGATATLDVCPQAISQAVAWLQLDGSLAVGRVRRTELTQLARSIHRFWRQRFATAAPAERKPQRQP